MKSSIIVVSLKFVISGRDSHCIFSTWAPKTLATPLIRYASYDHELLTEIIIFLISVCGVYGQQSLFMLHFESNRLFCSPKDIHF